MDIDMFTGIKVPGHKESLEVRTHILCLKRQHPAWGYGSIAREIENMGFCRDIGHAGVLSLVRRTIQRGTIVDRRRSGRPRTVRTRQNLKRIERLHKNKKNPGQRSTARKLGCSKTSVQRALKDDLGLTAFRRARSSKLTPQQIENRSKSCSRMRKKFGVKPESKNYKWRHIANSDWSGKVPLDCKHNSKNDVVYSDSAENVPKKLRTHPVSKFAKGFHMFGVLTARGMVPKKAPIFVK